MLQLILGRSGTGKTYTIYKTLSNLASEGCEKLILIVPEQFSFENERALLRELGPRLASRVQVLSFTRMAEHLYRELGGLTLRRMDDATRFLIMSRAMEQITENLTLYRRAASDPGAISTILSMVTELKQCGIAANQLEKASLILPEGTLKRKAAELALIMEAYETVAAGITKGEEEGSPGFIDPLDDLALLAKKLPESSIADGAYIFIDSFKDFTAPEIEIIEVLIRQAKQLTVSLCADTITDKSSGYGLFSQAIKTAARLRDIAYKAGVPVAKIQYLTENKRTSTEALKALEANIFMPRPEIYDKNAQEVVIASCYDIYEECDFVAREIRRSLRENGGRCRDFTVVARNLGDYRGVIDVSMEKQGIPFIMDERTDIRTEPLVALVINALDAVTGGYPSDSLLSLMKTGLAGFSTNSVAKLENYVFMWKINGSRWKTDWSGNPNGLGEKFDKEAEKQLGYLNLLRKRLVKPLEKLRAAIYSPNATGYHFSKAVYAYLLEVRADLLTRLRVNRLDSMGEPALAERMARVWDITMELLDKIAVIYGNAHCNPQRMAEIFKLSASLVDLGSVPQSLDAVQIGAADRIRYSAPKTVFILGANEGVFPSYHSPGEILTDMERNRLIELGLPLVNTIDKIAAEERFFAYSAVAAPTERLVVSFISKNSKGEPMAESVLVSSIKKILPQCRSVNPAGEINAESERDAFEQTALLWRKQDPKAAALKKIFAAKEEYITRVFALERAANKKPAAFSDKQSAEKLFGKDLKLTAYQIDSFYNCRFGYFCNYGLKAKPRRTAEMDALTFGTLTHWVMESVLPEYTKTGFDNITQSQVNRDTRKAVMDYVEKNLGGLEDKPFRFTALLYRLEKLAQILLWHVVCELRQSRFVPVDYELAIGDSRREDTPAIPPVVLKLPDGSTIQVRGKIDRVDVYKKDGVSYIRIIDYKTGQIEFNLSHIIEGLNVQMLLYLFAICENGRSRYGEIFPAGVLYLPAKLPVVQAERWADPEDIKKEQARALCMDGLLIDDPDIIRAMEPEAKGIFIPATCSEDGKFGRGSRIATLSQFGLLKKKIDSLLIEMAQTLKSGDIAAIPASGDVDACKNCSYKTVCWHEPEDPVRTVENLKSNEVFSLLEKAQPGQSEGTETEQTSEGE